MNLNIVLDVNIVLDLILKRPPATLEKLTLFSRLRKQGARFHFPACGLPSLEYIHVREVARLIREGKIKTKLSLRDVAKKQLDTFLQSVQVLSTPGFIWNEIPADHSDREDALIALSAAQLPKPVYLWTNDGEFDPVSEDVTVINEITGQTLLGSPQTPPMPFIDLAEQQIIIRNPFEKRLTRVLRHGQYIMGPEIRELEEKLAEYIGVKHCITCASGTDALLMTLMALDIGPGDEVITVPYTWISTAEVVALLRAKPVFVDIQPDTFNLDPDLLEVAITPRTKAIMPVGIYGQTADMTRIKQIAGKHGIPVIEDAAQCFGATHHGKKACNLSVIGCTSFFPSKPLGCYGDGGAIFTEDDALADKMRQIRIHGQKVKHQHPLVGINGRMDTMQAAILLEKFNLFPQECELRAEVGKRYDTLLAGTPGIQTPVIAPGNISVYAQYTILSPNREALSKSLQAVGIPSVAYYTGPLHLQGAFADLVYKPGDFPVTEQVAGQCLSLPMSPYLKQMDQEKVSETLKKIGQD
ncbi:MAG: aminotransferase class I/II-fold pyridoxal phosphate-dependent enzyme [Desulfatirhabdiaceae bacterium]